MHGIRAYYDPEVDLLMVELPHGEAPPADSEKLAPDVFLELEAKGAPLVLEVLRASAHYPAEWLRGIAAVPDDSDAAWPCVEPGADGAGAPCAGPHGRRSAHRRALARG